MFLWDLDSGDNEQEGEFILPISVSALGLKEELF